MAYFSIVLSNFQSGSVDMDSYGENGSDGAAGFFSEFRAGAL